MESDYIPLNGCMTDQDYELWTICLEILRERQDLWDYWSMQSESVLTYPPNHPDVRIDDEE